VYTDGWAAAQNAWLTIFPLITIIECFLYVFIKIRNRCQKRFEWVYADINHRAWNIYYAEDVATFQERVANLLHWTQQTITGAALEAIEKLCVKSDRSLIAFDYPNA